MNINTITLKKTNLSGDKVKVTLSKKIKNYFVTEYAAYKTEMIAGMLAANGNTIAACNVYYMMKKLEK